MRRVAVLKILFIMLAMALAPSAAAFAQAAEPAGSDYELAPPPDISDPHFRFTFAPVLVPMVRATAGGGEAAFARLLGQPSLVMMLVAAGLGLYFALVLFVRALRQRQGGQPDSGGTGIADAAGSVLAYFSTAPMPAGGSFAARERQQVMLRRAFGSR